MFHSAARREVMSANLRNEDLMDLSLDSDIPLGNYTIVHNQGHHFKVKTKEHHDDKELIVLVSTLGRSGSSWIGELLSMVNNQTMYIYEPMIMIRKIYGQRNTDAFLIEIIKNVMNCQMKQDIMNLSTMWNRVLRKVKEKCRPKCVTVNDINKQCIKAKTLVVKVRYQFITLVSSIHEINYHFIWKFNGKILKLNTGKRF